ncbi:MAG: AraC family transcriptional regulator, partial [Candidatus Aminicenantes bacterium]|nr:AraC family transcriptional regulator [Candidatus Aminicenantes bacterium]
MLPVDRKKLLRDEYTARINRVMDHVEQNLDRPLRLGELARVANFSPFHFHRIFSALVGETLSDFIRRLRLERSAQRLIDNPKKSIIEVALDAGFGDSAAFAKAFRERFGMSASAWRTGGYRAYRKGGQTKSKPGQAVRKTGQDAARPSLYAAGVYNTPPRRLRMLSKDRLKVEVKELPEFQVAYIRHVGPYQGIGRAFERLFRWAGPRGLVRFPQTKALAVYHDNPEITEADKLRSSACLTVPAGTKGEGEIGTMTIPGGLFAVARTEI